MIREATPADLPRIVEMGRAFHQASPYREVPFDPEEFGAFCERLMAGGVILLSDGGMIAGLLNPLYFNPSVVMGAELLWWAPEGGGRALREAFEQWVRERGGAGMTASALVDEHAERVRANYARGGYLPVETAFLKRF